MLKMAVQMIGLSQNSLVPVFLEKTHINFTILTIFIRYEQVLHDIVHWWILFFAVDFILLWCYLFWYIMQPRISLTAGGNFTYGTKSLGNQTSLLPTPNTPLFDFHDRCREWFLKFSNTMEFCLWSFASSSMSKFSSLLS